jgi:hypothetical protein
MPTVYINNLAVVLPSRFAADDVIGENAASVLQDIQLRRIKSKLRWLLAKGDLNPDGVQAKAEELLTHELVPYGTLDDSDDDDPVLVEALAMAREIIISRMAQEGLPPPRGIDIHAKALVDGAPQILERARLRIEARYKAANEIVDGAI